MAIQIIPLSEGSFTVDATKKFIPFKKNEDDLQARPTGSLLVEIQPFAVVTSRDVIIIDTGLGFEIEQGIMQIHGNLLAHNIQPASVTKVLLSHLHKDHSGGITDSSGELSFPNATYFVGQQEFDFASDKSNTSYIPSDFAVLTKGSQTKFLDTSGNIDDYIIYETTGGHCPYHISFKIVEDNRIIFYGGDVAPQYQQLKRRLMAKYDYDGRKAMELREKWFEKGKSEHWEMLFYHDISMPTVIL